MSTEQAMPDMPMHVPELDVSALMAAAAVATMPLPAVRIREAEVPVRHGGALQRHFLSRHKWSLRERTHLGLRAAAVPWPLLAVLAVQAGLSLRLVWSNTAFQDEALYLWTGRLEWAHWLHGTPVPAFPTYFSGAPTVYPPLGALADSIGASRRPGC
jgi:hypothetical protein